MDTEGLNSFVRDENVDLRLFLLTNLLCTTLIYNVMGSIDERAIESLSLVAGLSRYIDKNKSLNESRRGNLDN